MIWVIIIAIIVITIILNNRAFSCFLHSNFTKTMFALMGLCLSIFALFCGLFANDLTQHEKSAETDLYWFYPMNVVDFLIDELKYTIQDDAETVIMPPLIADTLNIQQDTLPIHYVFIVDKTLSSDKRYSDATQIQELKTILKNQLNEFQISCDTSADCFKNREDLMLTTNILKIHLENHYRNKNNTYQVIIYNGEHKKDCNRKHLDTRIRRRDNKYEIHDVCEFVVIQGNNIQKFVDEYKYLERDDRGCRNTNFAELIKRANDTIIFPVEKKNDKKVLTIYSDFVHEDKTVSFEDVANEIARLAGQDNIALNTHKLNIIKNVKTMINLVELEFNEQNQPAEHKVKNDNSEHYTRALPPYKHCDTITINHPIHITNNIQIIDNADTINEQSLKQKTMDLFHTYFHYCYKYNYQEMDIMIKEFRTFYFDHIITFLHKDGRFDCKKSEVLFHYPFENGKFNELSSAYIKFKQGGHCFLSVSDHTVVPCKFNLSLSPLDTIWNKDKKQITLSNNTTKEYDIDTALIYRMVLDVEKPTQNLEFVCSILKDSTVMVYDSIKKTNISKNIRIVCKETIPIRLITKLPKIVCYIMLVIITLFVVLLTVCLIYLGYRILFCKYFCHKRIIR